MLISKLLLPRSLRLRHRGSPDALLAVSIAILVAFGFLMLASASSNLGVRLEGDAYFFLKGQLFKGLSVGIVFFLLAYFTDYRIFKKLSVPLLVISIILLGLVIFTPLGETQKGATRWLNLGFFTMQPSEVIKFTFIVYLASWLSGAAAARRRKNLTEGILPFLIVAGIISFLILRQPATSVIVIIMFSALVVYFMSGARLNYIVGLILLGALVLSLYIAVTPYRRERVISYFRSTDSESQVDILGSKYHLNQARITIGSGGLWGVGFGQSLTKTKYLPEPMGDSIFAVVAEEFGFIGAIAVILLFFIIVLRGFLLARRQNDEFARLVLIGFSSLIGIQTFVHIASISGVIPFTGIPLPFISYGSTALVVFLSIAGLMLNLSRRSV